MPLLDLLNIHDGKWPPYAASLAFELYEDCDDPTARFVQVLYQHKPEIMLPYDDFKDYLSRFIPIDYAASCQKRQPSAAPSAKADNTTF